MQYNKYNGRKHKNLKTILDIDVETFEAQQNVIETIQNAARIHTANLSVEKNSFPLRPSSALRSKRDLYYGLMNYYNPGSVPVNDIEGRACMLLELGHAIEKHLVDNIKRAYKIPFTAQKITYGEIVKADSEKIELGGELDFVIELPSGERIICDSKSSGDFAFKLDMPKEEHIAQINLYLHSTWAREQNIQRAWIFYYNKNTSDLRLCEFYYDPRLAKAVISRFQDVYNDYLAGKLPSVEYVLGADWQATYSAYRGYEWAQYKLPKEQRVKASAQDLLLPSDKKKLLKYIVKNYGTQLVVTETREIFALANSDCSKMTLRDEGSDGFSSWIKTIKKVS